MVYTVTALGLPGGAGSADRLGPPRATAQTLYEWLFAPLREHVKTQAVLIASHQQLHYLPFSALHDGEQYLSIPSATCPAPACCGPWRVISTNFTLGVEAQPPLGGSGPQTANRGLAYYPDPCCLDDKGAAVRQCRRAKERRYRGGSGFRKSNESRGRRSVGRVGGGTGGGGAIRRPGLSPGGGDGCAGLGGVGGDTLPPRRAARRVQSDRAAVLASLPCNLAGSE
jgi:hypothetical protein